jgi:hypothetical protein
MAGSAAMAAEAAPGAGKGDEANVDNATDHSRKLLTMCGDRQKQGGIRSQHHGLIRVDPKV